MAPKKKTERGLFITFEGPDGAGKSTHAKRLGAHLRSQGHAVILTREPGGTPFGDKVRNILLDPETGPISPITELLMYESIRAHHVESLIRPALERGEIVISDRFTDASVAYQGYGRGIPIETVKTLNAIATSGLIPDITVIIDINSDTGLKAAQSPDRGGRLDRIEAAGRAFHRRVRSGYKVIAEEFPRRVVVVKRQRSPERTFELVLAALRDRLKL